MAPRGAGRFARPSTSPRYGPARADLHRRLDVDQPELGVLFGPTAGTDAREYGILLRVPRKVRLVAELSRAGYVLVPGGKGGHRKFRHPKLRGSVILTGDGDDAKDDQEKQVRAAIREAAR